MIRVTQSQGDVKELIHRIFKETGEILDVTEAMQLVEDDLINETLKVAQAKKVKSKLSEEATSAIPQQPQPKQIRTLTSRDNASPVMSRRTGHWQQPSAH